MLRRLRSGFTLVELVVALAVVAVIAAVAVRTLGTERREVSQSTATQVLQQVAAIQDLRLSTHGSFTDDPAVLGSALHQIAVVNGVAEPGELSVALTTVGGVERYGLGYHLGTTCYTLTASDSGDELFGSYRDATVTCSGALALEGPNS